MKTMADERDLRREVRALRERLERVETALDQTLGALKEFVQFNKERFHTLADLVGRVALLETPRHGNDD
jgi:hypothetical protein